MSETLQVEETAEAVALHDAPRLLVEWSSPWQEFVTSIRPALARSTARLAGETPFGLFPYRGMAAVLCVEAFLVFVAIVVPRELEELRPYIAMRVPRHEVIYYSADELPRTEDLGGSQAGSAGRAGGQQAHHRTQTIRIARGGSLVPKVVDAPHLKIPVSSDPVANLLAVRPDAGPPPVEGVRSSRSPLIFQPSVVAPAASVSRDLTRAVVLPGSVIAPAPNVERDKLPAAPQLNSSVVAPAPEVTRDPPSLAPALNTNVVAPPPDASHDKARSSPALAANVIPAPDTAMPEASRSPVQMANAVIPPPISAPERESARKPKVSLPAPSVVAPPPSTDISRDLHRLAAGSAPDPTTTVVAPPPAASSSGSFVGSLIGRIFGTTEVVPPPPSVTTADNQSGNHPSLTQSIVAPPTSVDAGGHAANRGAPSVGTKVVPPPATVSATGSSGTRANPAVNALSGVVAPPPQVSGSDPRERPNAANPLLANNVVPPPPALSANNGVSGTGRGSNGAGAGHALDVGSSVAPPSGGGSGSGPAAIVSAQPGPKVGLPNNGSAGALAMSPAGGDKPGLGGGGGGTGIVHGNGPGAAMTGENSGAGKTGSGRGSDPNAHGGISPASGPGGAGSGTSGTPPLPGVSVSGGSTMVTLPSFGQDSGPSSSLPSHSSVKPTHQAFDITVVATATSGGAFEAYKNMLPGGVTYTRYLDTALGSVVMEYADPASAAHRPSGTLSGPQPIRVDLPSGLPHARVVIACLLDASGNLTNLRLLEPGPAEMNAKVLAALHSWKFQPAMQGDQPVEVNAILGFNIDTNDR